jgi:hypothetical protein
MKIRLLPLLLVPVLAPVFAEPLRSPAWGFSLDLPEGYAFTEGNGADRYSFAGPDEARFDIRIYDGTYKTIQELAEDTNRRLKNQGETGFFDYRDKSAALIELRFGNFTGWGLCVELANPENGARRTGETPPMLLALSYGPAEKQDLERFHLSALDSIAPSPAERRCPGPVTEFGYPRGKEKRIALALPGVTALIRENDAEAAQALVDREFALLQGYLFLDSWQNAWIRFYRAVYRDSWDRLADAVFQLERNWNAEAPSQSARALAEKALAWVQTFSYERDLAGSDFVNLVSAAAEGRGDCDSRAMLWAQILAQADIPAAIMVSREYSHAMGLADIAGTGARFEAGGTKWLVAETSARVAIGLIGQNVSNVESWLGVIFE